MSRRVQVGYSLKKMTEAYLARCVADPVATAFGKTEEEAGDNLVDAIHAYVRLYPDRAESVLQPALTKELVLDDRDERR